MDVLQVYFDEKVPTPLCEIMGRNMSDKGHTMIDRSWHNYTTVYYSLFKTMKDKPLRVFELGLGTNNTDVPSNMGPHGRPGASLYGWTEFFPSATVFGADIDKRILFTAPRIRTYFCDQTNPTIIASLWNEPDLKENFDIIIEDGLHTYAANVCFFENSIHKLKLNGYYIIEDISKDDLPSFETKLKEWRVKYTDCLFKMVIIPSTVNTHDNTLLVVYKSD